MISIYWNSGPSKGCTDLLPSRWFKAETDHLSYTHDYDCPDGDTKLARCSVSVKDQIATINYGGDHTAYNKPNFDVGVVRLTFNDAERTGIPHKVEWSDPDIDDFEEVDVKCSESDDEFSDIDIAIETLDNFDPTNLEDGRKMIERMVILRQGQPAFRNALMDAYKRRCAITGCTVDAVLEAAHISPYLGDHTNHVTNGLLLRADLHTMFDRGIITIDGEYRITYRKDVVAVYKDLPEKLTFLPENLADQPNRKALDMKAESN